MFTISKSFDFCYGHRVYTQSPTLELALSTACPCKRLHGHQGKVTVYLSHERLDSRGFVIDFKELEFVKKFIDTYIDHHFIISTEDPFFEKMTGHDPHDFNSETVMALSEDSAPLVGPVVGQRFSCRLIDENPLLDSFFVVHFNPTSENLSRWIHGMIQEVMTEAYVKGMVETKVQVQKVIWSETPKTQAIYC